MIEIAPRLKRIKPSPSSTASALARKLREEGRDIVALTAGEPDFDTPAHIIEAAHKAMRDGQTRYTDTGGTPALKDAIREKFQRENALTYDRSEVMAGTGGKQIIFNALMATVDSGDEVIIPAPYWVSYPDIVLMADGVPVPLECTRQDGFKLTPDKLAAAITPRTKWLILNSPSNPTGACYTADELKALAAVLSDHPRIGVLTDDMYEHLRYGDEAFATMAQAAPEMADRVLTVNGLSKAYAMTGWRLGYAGGPAPLIAAMTKLQSQSTSNPSAITQAAAVAALSGPQDHLAAWMKHYRERRDFVVAAINDISHLSCNVPDGAFYSYIACDGAIGRRTPEGKALETDEDVCKYLIESVGVATVHGAAYGLSPCFRISFATDMATLKDACARMSKAMDALSQ